MCSVRGAWWLGLRRLKQAHAANTILLVPRTVCRHSRREGTDRRVVDACREAPPPVVLTKGRTRGWWGQRTRCGWWRRWR